MAVLIELPDPRAAALLALLDGSRSERVALTETAASGVALGDARDLLQHLHAAGLIMPGASLLPSTLTDDERRRLSGEAAALALARTADKAPPPPAQVL